MATTNTQKKLSVLNIITIIIGGIIFLFNPIFGTLLILIGMGAAADSRNIHEVG